MLNIRSKLLNVFLMQFTEGSLTNRTMNIVPPAAEKIVSIHLIPSCHSGLVPELYWSTVMNNAGALHIACHSRYGK